MESEENIIAQMSTYDFNSSVEVNVFIESDDENDQLNIKKDNDVENQPLNNETIINKPKSNEESKISNKTIHKKEENFMNGNGMKYESMEQLLAEFQIYYENDGIDNDKNSNNNISNKRKLHTTPSSPPMNKERRISINNNSQVNRINLDEYKLENFGINNDKNSNSNTSNQRKLHTTPSSPPMNKEKKISINNNSQVNIINLDEHKQDNQSLSREQPRSIVKDPNLSCPPSTCYGILDNHIMNLMNSVSEHLIIIMEAYIYYLHTKNNNQSGPQNIQKSFEYFKRIKNHLFGLSYSTTVNLLLPQENNVIFIAQFLKDTIAIANKKKALSLQYEQILPLYTELVQWTKQKELSLKNLPMVHHSTINNKYAENHYLLKQQINMPNKVNSNVHIANEAMTNIHYENNYLLKQQLNMPPMLHKVNSNVHNSHNSTSAITKSSTSSTVVPTIPTINNLHTIAPNQQQSKTSYSFGPPGREISINVDPALISNQNRPVGSNNNVDRSHTHPSTTYMNPNPHFESLLTQGHQRNTSSNKDYAHQKQNKRPAMAHIAPLNYPNSFVTPNNNMFENNNASVQMPLPLQAAVPPLPFFPPPINQSGWSNQTPDQQRSWTSRQPARQIQNQTTVLQSQPENTRSHSTDSGFISPDNLMNVGPVHTTINNCIQKDQDLITPFITHVTSLNPKASYINDGTCHVCGKITKLKCINCLKFYYCSVECQRTDWSLHVFLCQKHETNSLNLPAKL